MFYEAIQKIKVARFMDHGVHSARRSIATVSCPSVCLSVMPIYCGHKG